ncbi:hypothetical protein KCP75_00230 [Salmonella enterica subsp. enterica]|nr:hypothetical protein KCP75_00230 [Salmonella enterica subsp. enterica]
MAQPRVAGGTPFPSLRNAGPARIKCLRHQRANVAMGFVVNQPTAGGGASLGLTTSHQAVCRGYWTPLWRTGLRVGHPHLLTMRYAVNPVTGIEDQDRHNAQAETWLEFVRIIRFSRNLQQ